MMINWLKKLFGIYHIREEDEYPYLAKIINYRQKCIEEKKEDAMGHCHLYLSDEEYDLYLREYLKKYVYHPDYNWKYFYYKRVIVFNKAVIEEEKRREYFANPINFC